MTCKSLSSLSGFISIFLFCHIQMPLNGWWNCSWSSLDRPSLKVNTSCTGLTIKVNEAIKSLPFIMTIVSAHTPTPLSAKAINLCKVRFRHFIPAGNKNLIALYQCKSSQLWQLDAVRRPSKKKKGNVSVPLKKKKSLNAAVWKDNCSRLWSRWTGWNDRSCQCAGVKWVSVCKKTKTGELALPDIRHPQ